MLPPPPDAISLMPLLGTPPSPTLHSLYTSQIATLVWWTLQELSLPRRPVVVGLALERTARRGDVDGAGRLDSSASATYGSDEDSEVLDDEERERFLDIVSMAVAWPGPTSAASSNGILDPD